MSGPISKTMLLRIEGSKPNVSEVAPLGINLLHFWIISKDQSRAFSEGAEHDNS